jgi:hypothetical protein
MDIFVVEISKGADPLVNKASSSKQECRTQSWVFPFLELLKIDAKY